MRNIESLYRRPAAESEVVANYTISSPLKADSPYHEFASSPPTALFGKPQLWPGPESSATTARLLWNEEALYVCWELEGVAAPPTSASNVEEVALEALQGGQVQPDQCTVLIDERVECFLWQQPLAVDAGASQNTGQTYYAFEINYAGKALTNQAKFGGPMDFKWGGEAVYTTWTEEMALGWDGSSSTALASSESALPFKRVVIAELYWAPMGIDVGREVRVGLHRAQHPVGKGSQNIASGEVGDRLSETDVRRIQSEFVWSSWIDPGDATVNFHRPEFFGKLQLHSRDSSINCACGAARFHRPGELRILNSPLPSLAECPRGSLLVKAKYASICGSDLPYFKATRKPSSYWNRDGFCGHEVVGIVLESKSEQFQQGDAVMALPSSYFKALASSKSEWYRESVHGVLLKNFPVRGGFSEVYPTHELCSYKLRECVPRMLVAQPLGTMLRMAKRLGPVFGKTVVIIGQGQNGLMATRLMCQLCAKEVIAVDTVAYRRKLALSFGASRAFAPEEAIAGIAAACDGHGADVVLEMVGHNHDTINDALRYVASNGIVVAFGVPDDACYDRFEYDMFFRKNVKLIASVYPDPGVDFPEAVQLIERGQFSTEGILTHLMPFKELSRAFEVASTFADDVVKIALEFA
eukprot:TRINITY_DN40978_c0_g1_i1.p1 TRINITY_DN40978_c0_g1~~TRINITY_DN40978_c0_g1_i1.p1  ORF type:complete len:640 (-),score=107.11 TRINITY_DN40978_c0_g1_i1:38-1957(-)